MGIVMLFAQTAVFLRTLDTTWIYTMPYVMGPELSAIADILGPAMPQPGDIVGPELFSTIDPKYLDVYVDTHEVPKNHKYSIFDNKHPFYICFYLTEAVVFYFWMHGYT